MLLYDMKFNAYDYQRRAIDFIIEKPAALLALDMGLGKSVITLTAIAQLIDWCEIERALVVAPKTVAETTWSTEAKKWDHLHGLTIARVIGSPAQRLAALEQGADVSIIGRDNLPWLVDHYKNRLPFDMLVLDELTSFKSPGSLRFKAVRRVRPHIARVVGLTGTPAPNGMGDLWAQMFCIDQGARLGKSVTRYRDRFFHSVMWNHIAIKRTLKPGAEKEIRELIADITLTMQARDYLQLPAIIYHTERVTMPPVARRRYDAFECDRVMELMPDAKTSDGVGVLAGSAAALMNKLSQFANGAIYDDEHNVTELHDAKITRLVEIVEASPDDSGVLVFYQYQHDVPRIKAALKGLRVETYEGAPTLERWNAGEIDVLLAHPASTAYGLNMQQGGSVIVWFGTGWNLELYQQANARLYRQGQTRPVMIYRLITADTVDERALEAIENKQSHQQALLDGLTKLMKKYGTGKGI